MKKYDLRSYFNKIEYNWEKDIQKLEEIHKLTKTRVNNDVKQFEFGYGAEQTFLIKAVIEKCRAKNFFEIGTGRGTACYATSLVPSIENILTVDITPFFKKITTAIDYKPAHVSNADLYNMVPYDEKNKINFISRDIMDSTLDSLDYKFDVCFIDGDHTNVEIIIRDFITCQKAMKKDGIIIWDDYDPNRYNVKRVIDKVQEKNPQYNTALIEFRGHLFKEKKEADAGIVLMSTQEL